MILVIQNFGKINTTKIHKEILNLEKQLLVEKNEEEIIKILDNLLSYTHLLKAISSKYEIFDQKYSSYYKYIDKLAKNTNNMYVSISNYIKNNRILLRMLSKYTNQFKKNVNLLDKNFELKHITINDMLDITKEVFDKDFIDFMYKEFKNGNVHFNTCSSPNGIKNDYNGTCIDINNNNYYIIEKDKQNYFYNLFSIVHEISHGYINKKYNKDFTNNPFRESYSIFNELVLCKYFVDNNIAFNDCKLNDTFFFENLFENFDYLYFWTYLIDSVNEDGIVDDDNFKNIIQNESLLLNKLLSSDIDDDDYLESLIYSLDKAISIDLYYKYIFDPEKTNYLFNKLLSNNVQKTLNVQLNDLEINKLDFITCKPIKKYYNDYQKRYVKKINSDN